MANQVKEKVTVLDAQVAAGYSSAIRVTDFQHITFSVSGVTSSNQVVKVQTAIGSTAPTFSTAAILDNEWEYTETLPLISTTAVAGGEGITLSGVGVTQHSVNTDYVDWVSFQVVSGSAGSATVKLVGHSS